MGSGQPSKYKVEIREFDQFWRDVQLELGPASQQDLTAFMAGHMIVNPTMPIPHKLKQLKGEDAGFWQYDLAQFHRLIYTVDETARIVYVEYFGKHPDWSKHRGKRRGFRH